LLGSNIYIQLPKLKYAYMKKIYSLLIVLFALVSLQTQAQIPCNASFTTQSINGSTVKFNPLVTDSPIVQHYWNISQTNGGYYNYSQLTSPTISFPTGIFGVWHYILRVNPNGTIVCRDSSFQTITIAQGACLFAANFNSSVSYNNPLQFYYLITTNYLTSADSIRWTFADGTTSSEFYPTHTYPNYGLYNVCLRVIKRNPNGTLSNCVSEFCKLDTVAPVACNLQAYFTNTPDSVTIAPATIQFTNQTVGYTPTDSSTWSFGDGTPNSNLVNPNHVYASPGAYMVCLYVKKNSTLAGSPACRDTFCRMITIGTPCNLLANFTWYRDSLVTIPNSYHFTNTTTPLAATDSIRWTFGDGTSSNQVNPTHNYTTTGTFNVCLRVIKRNPNGVLSNCIGEKCYTIVVAPISTCNIQAYFTSSADSLQPNNIHFTNQSTGFASSDSITWIFGDGTTSNQINPTHTYTTAGAYTVCLRIKKNNTPAGTAPCVNIYCKVVVIALPCNLVANFTWYRDSLPTVALNTYHFTNTSVPLAATDSIRWTFGDGTSSNQVNPTHVYANAGTYNVCLRVIKRTASGVLTNCVGEKCYTIIVPQQCNIVASYTWQADVANFKRINFTNTTIAPTAATALWNFGDGTTASTWNVAHIYAQPGRYYICLRVQYGNCISYKCDSINIVEPPFVVPCIDLAKFSSATFGNGSAAFAVFYPQNNVQYTWTFGDGTGAQTGLYASHTYATSGTFNACLTAFKDSNCASTSCRNIYITPNCNNITLTIGDVRDSLIPNRIKFTALSNTATTSQQWTITKIPTTATSGTITINTNNPTYMFLDSGYYNVCVRATYANGCVKTICKTIYIAQNLPGSNVCTLQAYPNPASTVVNTTVTLAQPQIINATIYNITNAIVSQTQQQGVVGINTISVNIASLPAGIYTIRVLYGGQVCYAPFIKQ
jgi:PKD repeat protein